jgi:hypothetical protein
MFVERCLAAAERKKADAWNRKCFVRISLADIALKLEDRVDMETSEEVRGSRQMYLDDSHDARRQKQS